MMAAMLGPKFCGICGGPTHNNHDTCKSCYVSYKNSRGMRDDASSIASGMSGVSSRSGYPRRRPRRKLPNVSSTEKPFRPTVQEGTAKFYDAATGVGTTGQEYTVAGIVVVGVTDKRGPTNKIRGFIAAPAEGGKPTFVHTNHIRNGKSEYITGKDVGNITIGSSLYNTGDPEMWFAGNNKNGPKEFATEGTKLQVMHGSGISSVKCCIVDSNTTVVIPSHKFVAPILKGGIYRTQNVGNSSRPVLEVHFDHVMTLNSQGTYRISDPKDLPMLPARKAVEPKVRIEDI